MKWFYLVVPVLIFSLVLSGCNKKPKIDLDLEETGSRYDYSNPDAPKTIVSKDIVSFQYSFPSNSLNELTDRNIPYGYCNFSLSLQEDSALCRGRGQGERGIYAFFDYEFLAPLEVLGELQELIDVYELAKINGLDKGVKGVSEEEASHLEVIYESEEKIYARDGAGQVLSAESTLAIYDFFVALAQSEDEKLIYTEEAFWELYSMLQGGFVSGDGKMTVVFDDYSLYLYEGEELIEKSSCYLQDGKLFNYSNGAKEFVNFIHFVLGEDALLGITEDNDEVVFTRR